MKDSFKLRFLIHYEVIGRNLFMNKIANLSNILNEFFNKTADEISLATGFIKRKRKLKGSSFIKALILGNLGNGNCSTRRILSIFI